MLKAEVTLEVLDKEGKVVKRHRQPARSFVRQFIQLSYVLHSYLSYSVTDVDGVSRAIALDFRLPIAIGGPGDSTNQYGDATGCFVDAQYVGLQLGTGTTAPTSADYAMESRIAHGVSTGQLEYGGSEARALSFNVPAGTGQFTLRRYFTNNSGGSITVREVGINAIGKVSTTIYFFLICRDVLASPVTVNDGELLRVTYDIKITI